MADVYDGPWRLFNYDYLTGRSIWVLHEDGKIHFRVDYPVENLIRSNAEANAETSRHKFGEFVRVAAIPTNIYYDSGLNQAQNEGDRAFVKRWLNDSDNQKWRTHEGHI